MYNKQLASKMGADGDDPENEEFPNFFFIKCIEGWLLDTPTPKLHTNEFMKMFFQDASNLVVYCDLFTYPSKYKIIESRRVTFQQSFYNIKSGNSKTRTIRHHITKLIE